MGLKIAGTLFYGPHSLDEVIVKKNHHPAIYAIVCRTGEPWNPLFRLLDIDFSGTQGMVLADDPRRQQWERENDGLLQVYLLDLKRRDGEISEQAKTVIAECRRRYQPPKGFISLAE